MQQFRQFKTKGFLVLLNTETDRTPSQFSSQIVYGRSKHQSRWSHTQ